MVKQLFATLLLLTFFIQPARSEDKVKNFSLFSLDEGFYGTHVSDLIQDNHGFIWIGSNQGIYTYDGAEFKQFDLKDDAAAVVNGNIQALFKDKDGNIWAAANTGLTVYLEQKGRFVSVKLPSASDWFISGISQDSAGYIWVSTNMGLYKISPDGKILSLRPHKNPGENFRITFYKDLLWLVDHNKIYSLDVTRQGAPIVDSLWYSTERSTADNLVTDLSTDENGNIWIGKQNGNLLKFNTNTRTTKALNIKKKTNNPSAIITDLLYDEKRKEIWAAVDEGGIYKIDPGSDKLKVFTDNKGSAGNLPGLKITSLLIDREQNVWLDIKEHGLALTNDLTNSFSFIDTDPYTSASIVSSVLKDKEGNLWVGTDGGGLLRYSKNNQFKQLYKHDADVKNSLSNNAVLELMEDSKGRILAGTFRGGLSIYDPEKKSFTGFYADSSGSNELISNDIRKISEDKNGNLWMAAHGYGVTKLSSTSGESKHYRTENRWTIDILTDRNGIVWVAAKNGISYYDKTKDAFIPVKFTQSIPAINVLHEDTSGTFWIGTARGLYYFNSIESNIHQLPHQTILNNATIENIAESGDGNLVFTTKKDLMVYNLKTKETLHFTAKAGLPASQFVENSSFVWNNNLVYIGTSSGLLSFRPSELKFQSSEGKPVITEISLDNEPIENKISLGQSVTNTSSVNLKHDQNNIAFKFSYPWYSRNASLYNFQYMMEGIDNKWQTSSYATASYPSLPSGNYKFKVRLVSKAHAQQYSPEASIVLNISPPFWDTIWFKVLAVLLIGAGFYVYFKNKTRRVVKINRQLEEKVRERTLSITKQNELLEKQKAELDLANRSKDKIFSVIGHDLRSPFSSFQAITDLLQHKSDTLSRQDQKTMLLMLRKTSENTLQLLDNLLNWGRTQTQSITYSPQKVVLTDLVEEVAVSLETVAESKGINIRRIYEYDFIANTDKEMLQTILRNLVSNSIKYTPENGKIIIKSGLNSGEQIEIQVQDTGQGMSEADIERIQKPGTFVTSQPGTNGEAGTGLGLSLCREFLSHMDAHWEIISTPGHGTTFKVLLSTEYEIVAHQKNIEKVKEEPSGIQASDFIADAATSPSGKVILVVEDQYDIRESLIVLLSGYYKVLVASNGVEALEILKQKYIDLVLSDVVMPEMDGIELSVKCKEDIQTNHIPVILLTSQKDEADIINGLQTGVDDYLLKPVNAEILLLKIEQVLKTRDLLKKKFSLSDQELLKDIEENPEKELFKKVLKAIDEHLHEEKFGVEALSKYLGLHRTTLSKKLVSVAEISPGELIKVQRLKKAARLLMTSNLNVSEVAWKVGFSDPKYFSRSFRAYFGSVPKEYVRLKSKTKDSQQIS